MFRVNILITAAFVHTIASATNSIPSFLVPAFPSSYEETISLLALQGLLNRNSPAQLWLNASSNAPDLENIPVMWVYPDADHYWIEYLSRTANINFTVFSSNDLCTVLTPFINTIDSNNGAIKGLIIYNTTLDVNYYLSLTMAGLYNLLPVTQSIIDSNPCLTNTIFTNSSNIHRLPSYFTNNLDGYDWGISNLLNKTSKKIVVNACHTPNSNTTGYACGWSDPIAMATIDFGVMSKSFICNLSPDPSVGNGEQYNRFIKIISHLNPIGIIAGWNEPETTFVATVSEYGCVVLCGAPNLSFFHSLNVSGVGTTKSETKYESDENMRLPTNFATNQSESLDKTKYYIIFQSNEGDTAKNAYSLRGGNWIIKNKIYHYQNFNKYDKNQILYAPIAWGVDPLIAQYFPYLWKYYIDTSTNYDSFFGATAGSGYVHPWHLSNENQQLYFQQTGKFFAQYMPKYMNSIDVWPWQNTVNYSEYTSYQNVANSQMSNNSTFANIECFSQQPTVQTEAINSWNNATPIFLAEGGNQSTVSLWYPQLNASDPLTDLVQRIDNVASQHNTPFFILIYGCTDYVNMSIQVINSLDSNKFSIIGAQDMCDLGMQAGA